LETPSSVSHTCLSSDEGKICYKVCYAAEDQYSCTCGDFAKGIKNDQRFKCKHVLAVASCVPNGDQEKAQFLERRKPKLDERFITTIENKDFVLYAGLLDLAHQRGILKIDVDPIQLPTKENDHMWEIPLLKTATPESPSTFSEWPALAPLQELFAP